MSTNEPARGLVIHPLCATKLRFRRTACAPNRDYDRRSRSSNFCNRSNLQAAVRTKGDNLFQASSHATTPILIGNSCCASKTNAKPEALIWRELSVMILSEPRLNWRFTSSIPARTTIGLANRGENAHQLARR